MSLTSKDRKRGTATAKSKVKGRKYDSVRKDTDHVRLEIQLDTDIAALMDFLAADFKTTKASIIRWGLSLLFAVHGNKIQAYMDKFPDSFIGTKDALAMLTTQACAGGNMERVVEHIKLTDDTILNRLSGARGANY